MTDHAEPPSTPTETRVVVIDGPLAGSRAVYRLTAPVISIGRVPGADIVLPADSVSRRHAAFEWSDGAWTLRDVASTGGTFVNGEHIVCVVLRGGERIAIGSVILAFVAGGDLDDACDDLLARAAARRARER
jgi:pSer/pThr/pTyr-binding forkhead associated (FHA) protein